MKKTGRRLGALLLAAVMAFSLLPVAAFAAGDGTEEAWNLALGQPVAASSQDSSSTADKAVDGNTSTTQWSSGDMKTGGASADPDAEQTHQWLWVDLGATGSQIDHIKLYYNMKVWPMVYEIQTADDVNGAWETVVRVERSPFAGAVKNGAGQNIADETGNSDPNSAANTDTITTTSVPSLQMTTLKRYVRVYIEKVNTSAPGNNTGIRELEIYGTNPNRHPAVDVTELLASATTSTVTANGAAVSLPSAPSGATLTVAGSSLENVVANDGTIGGKNIGAREVALVVRAWDNQNPDNYQQKNLTVTVPDHKGNYPAAWFPTVTNANAKPEVIPAIQEWYGYTGSFTLSESSRIVINDAAGVDIQKAAENMKADLKEISGLDLPIVTGTSGGANDIYIESQTADNYDLGKEGYLMRVSDEGIKIYAPTYTGCIFGTITVEQILWQAEDHLSVSCGIMRDYPAYEVRGLKLDIGRAPTRYQQLQDYAKIMLWYKMSEFDLHINDTENVSTLGEAKKGEAEDLVGFHRLESDTFPSLKLMDGVKRAGVNADLVDADYYNAADGYGGNPVYTKQQWKDLAQLAKDYGMHLLTEIDMPGHALAYNNYVEAYPEEAAAAGVSGPIRSTDTNLDYRATELLELTGDNAENALNFAKALWDEYTADGTISGDVVHIGADEYWVHNSATNNAFVTFADELRKVIQKNLGSDTKIRMWGATSSSFAPATTVLGKTHKELAEDYELEIWSTGYDNPVARSRDGYKIVNCEQSAMYSCPGRHQRDVPNAEYVFNSWDPTVFGGSHLLYGDPNLLGAKAVMWGEQTQEGLTERDVHQRVLRAIAIVSEKTWTGKQQSEGTFSDYEMRFNRLAEGPGTEIAMNVDSETSLVLDYDFKNISTSGTTVFDQSGNGYNGTLNAAGTVDADGFLTFDGSTLLTTDLTTLSYPYTVSFDLKADAGNTKESSLFSGYDGRIQVAGHNGKLSANACSFIRDFNYTVPTDGTAVNITLVGTFQATRLYVNGELVTFLSQTGNSMQDGVASGAITSYFSSVPLPLERIGQDLHGKMANLKVYNKAMSAAEVAAVYAGTDDGKVNVAQNAIAGGSSYQSGDGYDGGNNANQRTGVAQKAVDGEEEEMYSFWRADHSDSALTVDLGQTRAVSEVEARWSGTAPGSSVQVSTDGTTWTNFTNGTAVNARYVKVNANGAGNLQELLVYEQVDKTTLSNLLELTEGLVEEDGLNFETTGEGKELFDAVVFARAVNGSPLATKADVTRAVSGLREFVNVPSLLPPEVPANADVKEDWKTDLRPADGTTQGQPFPGEGLAGGDFFRIPALITIENGEHTGRIVAMTDARWKHMGDGNNIDTLLSYSDDNGATWHYSFPNFFGDTMLSVKPNKAAIFMDPVLAQDKEGNIYLMADACPAGHSTWGGTFERPEVTNGFVEIDGVKRMPIYTSPENSAQDDDNYSYYIGDFASIDGSETKYAPILEAEGGFESGFYTDDHFYLYFTTRKTKDPANDKIYCAQMDGSNNATNTWVQQNLFFYNATLHVRNAQYLYLIKSTDGGATWSAPKILNDQVRTGEHNFYGPGPGAGTYLDDGTIILPCYHGGTEYSSFIYSTDGGETWTRTESLTVGSSESTIVQIDDTTVRQFYRSGSATLRYIDYTKDAAGVWTPTNIEVDTGAVRRSGNQLASIRYSEKVEGKDIIMVSTATSANGGNAWSRWHGVIHTFAVNADKTMTLLFTTEINGETDWYGYSSLAELPDGSLGLLYESSHTDASKYTNCSIRYITVPVNRSAIGLAIVTQEANAMVQDDYYEDVPGAWSTFQTALAAANTVMEDENATTEQVESAAAALKAAMANLSKVEVVISGTVTGVNGAGVAGAVVTLENSAYRPVGLTATTDAEGNFEFRETDTVALTVADYQLKVQAVGYQVTTKPAEAITKNKPDSHTEIELEAEEPGAYVNNFDGGDISMMGTLTTETNQIPTYEAVTYNGSGAVKITFHSTGDQSVSRNINNAVDKTEAAKIANGVVSFDITGLTNTVRLGVTLRGTAPNNRIFVGQQNDPAKWFWERWTNGNNDYSSVETKEIGIYPGETRTVRVELNGAGVKVAVDGIEIYNATMNGAPTEAGYVGINLTQNPNTSYILDNLRIVSADPAADNTYTIAGTVTEGTTALAGAAVDVYSGGTLVTSTVTNASGAYKTQSVQPGTYTVKVSAPGYAAAEKTVTVGSANISGENFALAPDKTALNDLYNENKDREKGNFTAASWTALQTALEAAKTVLDKDGATRGEISKAMDDLTAAVEGLKMGADKTALQTAYDAAKGVTNDNYTAATWNKFLNALATAEAMLESDSVTQAQVDAAANALTLAQEGLKQNSSGGNTGDNPGGNSGGNPPVNVSDEPNPPVLETETKENEDGSITTTVTDVNSGAVTETTVAPDGAKVEKIVDPEEGVSLTATDASGETVAQIVIPAVIPEPAARFADVPEGHWADEAIHKIAALGVVEGVGENKYSMNTPMSRGALATVLHRLSSKPTGSEVSFKDVSDDKYYAEGVAWAAKVGVVEGFSAEEFRPEATITREQLALMLTRYAELLGMDVSVSATVLEPFSDQYEAHTWSISGVAWCVKAGIIKGRDDGTLAPTDNVTRAEVAMMIQRFIDLVK